MPKEVNQQSQRIPIWVSLLLTKIISSDNVTTMLVHLTAAINDHKHHYYYRITPSLPIILHCSTVLYLHVPTRLVSFIHFQYHQRCSIFIEWNRCKICTFIRILWIFIICRKILIKENSSIKESYICLIDCNYSRSLIRWLWVFCLYSTFTCFLHIYRYVFDIAPISLFNDLTDVTQFLCKFYKRTN